MARRFVFICAAVAALGLGFQGGADTTVIPPPAAIRVLHISVLCANELRDTVKIAGAGDWVKVTQKSLEELNNGHIPYLPYYDVVLLGMNDCGECPVGELSFRLLSSLNQYVLGGGGVVWTHDFIDCCEVGDDLGLLAEGPAGIEFTPPWDHDTPGGDLLLAVGDHQTFHFPFETELPATPLGVAATHTTGGRVTTATVLLRFDSSEQPATDQNFYLTVNQYGAGRVLVNQIGHSFTNSPPLHDWSHPRLPAEMEARLLVNCLFWAAGVTMPCVDCPSPSGEGKPAS